nr:hypothetical protein [Polycladomyces abyssicola]
MTERIGLLDERFGVGTYEDDDYCYRARLAGYRCVIAGDTSDGDQAVGLQGSDGLAHSLGYTQYAQLRHVPQYGHGGSTPTDLLQYAQYRDHGVRIGIVRIVDQQVVPDAP